MVNLLTCAGFEPHTDTLVGLGMEFEGGFTAVAEFLQTAEDEIYAMIVADVESGEVVAESEPMAVPAGTDHATMLLDVNPYDAGRQFAVRLDAVNRGRISERIVMVT